jgi:lipoxygenase homology domain-containing protein 1
VYTGDKSGAGTDANVFIIIYGENGDTGERNLRKSDHLNKFERNQCDTFIVKAIELGDIQKIRIYHDNSSVGSAWYLEKVEIFNPNTNRS